jgi:pyruvate dehydrogenase E2 component (dihydrolipoamide acetyltransferase)
VTEFKMPSLGADMDRGKVVEWLLKEGDPFERGGVIVLVETDKGIIEVEIWDGGTMGEILVGPGEEVAVGTVIARYRKAGEEPEPGLREPAQDLAPEVAGVADDAGAAEPPIDTVRVEPVPSASPPVVDHPRVTPPIRHLAHQLEVDMDEVVGSGPGGTITRMDIERAARPAAPRSEGRLRASPRARRVAEELGIDLAGVAGSGPSGVISEADILAHAGPGETKPVVTPPVVTEPAQATVKDDIAEQQRAAMRRAIGQVMAKSKREIPHYYLGTDIDMSRALAWLEEENLRRTMADRLLAAVLMLKAAALAIRDVPEMNGFWLDEEFQASDDIHLGVAVSLRQGGLIAPAIHHSDRMSLDELMTGLKDLVARARTGRLRSSEMSDPTITITNLGDRGVAEVYGVIYAPQVALVGFGKATQRPWIVDGLLGTRPIVRATLSADHRVSDGHRGGIYLQAIDRYLQEPEQL